MSSDLIVFSRPFRSMNELANLEKVLESGHVQGDGPFTESATAQIRKITGVENALLTTSCTHALEMASILLELGPGDEVILPSFTFSSGATAVASSGATCVFVDNDPLTGNIDPERVAEAVTSRTRAISVMHYGGVAGDMDSLLSIAQNNGLVLIEDNAHGLGATWKGQGLGSIGSLATQSFHSTKNVHCGEGGALLVNDPSLMARAEIIREKGTNRSRFLRGQVDKYSWIDRGSSYLPSELNAAVLDSQLAEFDSIQAMRHHIWDRYSTELADWAERHGIYRMTIPEDRQHPAHLFYLLMPTFELQQQILEYARANGVIATFHYVPLDSSEAGRKYGRTPRECSNSLEFSQRLVRLPLWAGMSEEYITRVISVISSFPFPTGV